MKKILLSMSALLSLAVANAQEQRVPLLEIFTSSTCPPCFNGNVVYEGVVSSKPMMQYVSVKYQQNFPGTGDPYSTLETVNRRSFYGINAIPWMTIDGGWNQNSQSFTNALYDQYRAIPAEFKLYGTYTVNATSKVVTAKIKYSPLTAAAASATGIKLYVAIIEKLTTKNKRTNGETQFFNVVKKMLPSETGNAISGYALNKLDSMNFTYTFNGNYRLPADGQVASHIVDATENSVEDFTKLRVVCWLEDGAKKVYQAANLVTPSPTTVAEMSKSVGSYTLYPNPSNAVVNIDFNMNQSDNVSVSILNLSGAVVAQKTASMNAGSNKMSFDTQELPNGFYNVVILDSKNNNFVEKLAVFH